MDVWEGLLEGPSANFPRGPAPNPGLHLRPWLLAGLLLACLIPRSIAAWKWDILWGDSLRYRYASICLEQGDFEHGFAEFGLNVYPIILIPLRHLGIDWQITGKWFGVFVAAATVLPLFGWLRRMFDDRLAVIACLVYALHGKLIAISPLIIRDSTFWFLLVLSLYFLWRALGELRIGLFLAAGFALTLAVHTRTEGWLLVVPLAGWAVCRWATAKGNRFRLILGALLCLALIPAVVAVVNVTWLRQNPRWEFLRTAHIGLAIDWWNTATGMHLTAPVSENALPPPSIDASAAAPIARTDTPRTSWPAERSAKPAKESPPKFESVLVPEAVPPELTTPGWTLTFKLLERLAKACTWIGCALLLVGLISGWRIFRRPEHLTLFVLNCLLLAITRVRYAIAGIDQRYFMPIVIISIPWMALGLDCILLRARLWAGRHRELSPRASRILAGGLIAVAVACSLIDGPISVPAYMKTHADMGRWIYRHAGPTPTIAGNIDEMALETFYANGRVVSIFWPRDCLLVPLPVALTGQSADVVVLWNDEKKIDPKYLKIVAQRIMETCQYRRVDASELPLGPNELLVFVRR